MSDEPLAAILAELRKMNARLDNAEREQARFRAEASARHDRILAALQEVRDDVTVAVHLAGRADAATGREAELGRNLISQLSRLRTRVEAIESRLPPATE